MTIKEILNQSIGKLKEAEVEEASLVSKILLADILEIKKEELIIKSEEEISEEKQEKYLCGIEKIKKGYPLQYITQKREFMKMEFIVNENVLIPRQDTEILVEEAIKQAKEKKEVLDMCTGSGAIAISLAKYTKNISITATDISEKAIEIAKQNAKKLLENHEIQFIKSDMFENIQNKYDIIISNPPYIKTEEIKNYKLEYEPKLALDGGKDGLKFYKKIIQEGYKYLNPEGIIMLEIGYDQKEEVKKLIEETKQYKKIYSKKDLYGNDRIIVCSKE